MNFPDRTSYLPASWFGSLGVTLFFVLSGFIIMFILESRKDTPVAFVARQFYRIFPMYILFTAAILIAWAIDSRLTFGLPQPDTIAILKSLLIWLQDRFPILFVGWSIEHEIVFYAVIGILLFSRHLNWAPTVLLGLFAVGPLINPVNDAHIFHVLSLYNFNFALGVLIYRWQHSLRQIGIVAPALFAGTLVLLILSLSVGSSEVVHQPSLSRVLAGGLAGGALLVCLLNAELMLRSCRIFVPLIAIGDAAYVLYLSHPFTLAAGGKIGVALGTSDLLVLPWLALLVLGAVIFSIGFHRTVERPYLRYARRKLTPGRQQQASSVIARQPAA